VDPVILVVALALALGILLITVALASQSPADPVQARLSQISATSGAPSLEELELQLPLFDRTLRPLAQRISGMAARLTSAGYTDRIEKRIALAGHPSGMRTAEFLGLRLMSAGIGSGLGALLGLIVIGGLPGAVVGLAAGFFGGYVFPDLWLSRRIRARQHRILMQVPDALDLLTISVRAGLGFDAALAKVVEKMDGPLPDEFRRALAEVRVGRVRREALRDVVTRTEVPALANFIGAVIQAEQLGVAISKVLQVQSEQLRIERRQRAEEMAAKAPIKMLFPLVGCIFPAMFIVLLGPAMIRIIAALAGTNF
jgi:tight adherence protein C